MEYHLWQDAREAERAYQESSAETIDAWLAREVAETAYDKADRALMIAQEAERTARELWIEARARAESAFECSVEHDRALGA